MCIRDRYPAQWNWDSAFIALGYSYFNLDFSITEIETLLNGQWDDGMVPHILFHEKDTSYFPNHTTWQCGKNIPSSGITQPPVLASILRKIVEKNQLSNEQHSRIVNIITKIHDYKIKREFKKSHFVSFIIYSWLFYFSFASKL